MLNKIKLTLHSLLQVSRCRSRHIAAVVTDSKNNIVGCGVNNPTVDCVNFAYKYGYDFDDDGRCPRRILGFGSGEGLSLCHAEHAEVAAIKDAVYNNGHMHRMYMTCECPCFNCARYIVDSHICEIYIIDKPDYDPRSRTLFKNSGVNIHTWDYKF
jgi:deoxycytidylate deaminase